MWGPKEPPAPGGGARRLEQFAAKSRGALLARARRVCRSQGSDAEDLVQETFLRFFQQGEKGALPEESHWEAWLGRTFTNLFYDQCRRQKVQARRASDPALGGEPAVIQEHAVRSIYESVSQDQVAQVVEQSLSPTLRETFKLHAGQMSNQEIAQVLGIPSGTVRKRLHDARMKLKELLLPPGEH